MSWEEADFEPMEARGGRAKGAHVIKLFDKRAFDYSFLSNGASQIVVVSRALRLVPFYYYWLLMRVHNADIPTGSNGTVVLRCWNTLPSAEDPREFTIGGTSPLFVTVNPGAAAGTLLSASANNQGPLVKVELAFTQGSTAGQRFYAELSAVLYGRAS